MQPIDHFEVGSSIFKSRTIVFYFISFSFFLDYLVGLYILRLRTQTEKSKKKTTVTPQKKKTNNLKSLYMALKRTIPFLLRVRLIYIPVKRSPIKKEYISVAEVIPSLLFILFKSIISGPNQKQLRWKCSSFFFIYLPSLSNGKQFEQQSFYTPGNCALGQWETVSLICIFLFFPSMFAFCGSMNTKNQCEIYVDKLEYTVLIPD